MPDRPGDEADRRRTVLSALCDEEMLDRIRAMLLAESEGEGPGARSVAAPRRPRDGRALGSSKGAAGGGKERGGKGRAGGGTPG